MIRFFYNLLFPFVFLFLLPKFILRMFRRGKYRHKFGQRLGFYSARVRKRFGKAPTLWIHAVSVGEMLIALKLVRTLHKENPSLHFALSTTTSTGFALARKHQSAWLEPIYHPIDFPWIVQRTLRMIRPIQLILVEAEVWPNLVAYAHKAHASVVLVNARLSKRSEHRYQKFQWITGPLFRSLDAICVPEKEDVRRWESIGAEPRQLHLTGSIKFDEESPSDPTPTDLSPLLQQIGIDPSSDPILLGGSTHAGEEKLLAEVARTLRQKYPRLFLILVPRHVERTPSIQSELEADGFQVCLRDALPASAGSPPDILLVNTTGELRHWYRQATLVFVGKSLTAKGGQNPAEALSVGKPVLFGPHMGNFSGLVHGLLSASGAATVNDADDLEKKIDHLLTHAEERTRMVQAGEQVLAFHRGATQRTVEVLKSFGKLKA